MSEEHDAHLKSPDSKTMKTSTLVQKLVALGMSSGLKKQQGKALSEAERTTLQAISDEMARRVPVP